MIGHVVFGRARFPLHPTQMSNADPQQVTVISPTFFEQKTILFEDLLLVPAMEISDGKLCQVCTATLQGKTVIPDYQECHRPNTPVLQNYSFDRVHHENYSSLTKSKDDGCCICCWLWESHTPPPLTSTAHGLKTFCQLYRRNPSFCVTCSWAPDFGLRGKPPPRRLNGPGSRLSR